MIKAVYTQRFTDCSVAVAATRHVIVVAASDSHDHLIIESLCVPVVLSKSFLCSKAPQMR
ncbi:hypothetical protein YC2023_075858 [Brassica napus]